MKCSLEEKFGLIQYICMHTNAGDTVILFRGDYPAKHHKQF